jgi:hypothetical protein
LVLGPELGSGWRKKKMEAENNTIYLTPHHLLDVLKDFGSKGGGSTEVSYKQDLRFPIILKLLENPKQKIELVFKHDDLCKKCRYLNQNHVCVDMFSQFFPPLPRQIYADELNEKLFSMLDFSPGYITKADEFLAQVLSGIPALIALATHPGEDEEYTGIGLRLAREILKQ